MQVFVVYPKHPMYLTYCLVYSPVLAAVVAADAVSVVYRIAETLENWDYPSQRIYY